MHIFHNTHFNFLRWRWHAIALSWVKPYAFGLDAGGLYEPVAQVPLTLLLLVSVFVLGGDFWDKLGALFRYRTKVAFPDEGQTAPCSWSSPTTRSS